ncbi:MAG: LptA/OstA family protein [bacterium]
MKNWITLFCILVLGSGVVCVQGQTPSKEKTGALGTQPMTIESEQLDLDFGAHKGVFRDKVHVTSDNFDMTSNEATVYLSEKNEPERFVAKGDVAIKSSERSATARNAEYVMAERKMILTGEPVVIEKRTRVTGTTIIIHVDTKKMQVLGRSTVQIMP